MRKDNSKKNILLFFLFSSFILFFLFILLASLPEQAQAKTKTKTNINTQVVNIKINFSGLPNDLVLKILPTLSLQSLAKWDTGSAIEISKDPTERVTLLYERSIQQILNGLKIFGYYKASVKSNLIQAQPGKTTDWTAEYEVHLGPPLLIKQLDFKIIATNETHQNVKISNAVNKNLNKIFQASALKKDNILNQEDYENLKKALLNRAIALGYFDAKFSDHVIKINLLNNTSNIILILNLGEAYYFGETSFDQSNYIFKESFLRRFLPYVQNNPYRVAKINQLQAYLSNTEYFSDLTIQATPDKKTKKVNIHIKTIAQKKYKYTLGLGYGTETGPRITLGTDIRYVNSEGNYMSFTAQLSKIYQEIIASYIIPGKNPVTDYTSINAGESYTDIIPYSATEISTGVDFGTTRGRWTQTLGVHETWIHYDTPVSYQNRASYLLPSAAFSYQDYQKQNYYSEGMKLSIFTTGTVESPFSQATFIKTLFSSQFSFALAQQSRIFFRTQAGAIGTHSLTNLSPTERFYTGGIGSIRGYAYSSLSPENIQDQLTGGRYLIVGSVNLEQHLFGDLSGLIFYDAGNSFNKIKNIPWAQGAGLGFGYQSPIGPLYLYFSHPLAQNANGHWRIDFSVGTAV